MAPSKSKTTIERTAIAEFRLGDRLVPVGTIVTLTPAQVEKLDAAGCVFKDDAKNADAPVAEMPETQGSADTEASRLAAEADKAKGDGKAADKPSDKADDKGESDADRASNALGRKV